MAHNVKLDTLSMTDLQQLIADAQKALGDKVEGERAELLKKLSALDAIAKPTKAAASTRQRAAPQPKYRSKKNPDLTWAGRGGTPRWLAAEMEETGKKLEEFAI